MFLKLEILSIHFILIAAPIWKELHCQSITRRVGKLQEVFAWTQLTYNINGNLVIQDRFGEDNLEDQNSTRRKRQSDNVFFNNNDEPDRNWNKRPNDAPMWNPNGGQHNIFTRPTNRVTSTTQATTTNTNNFDADAGRFFVQYNNLPMGAERYKNRLFVAVPRRRHGIPSTLNYLDLTRDSNQRSPGLRPYPNLRDSRSLVNVYRTRADACNRLWMVDTGLLEIPNAFQQLQQPSIVIYDLNTDRQILKYLLRNDLLPSANTPTGLASITVDVDTQDCSGAYAYIPDLASYGIIVYSLRDNESWRLSHNYFHFNPVYGNLNIAGQRFQWNDGIFSITLSPVNTNGCKTAYFHPMASNQEFSVSTCVMKNRTASAASNYWENFSIVGDRGENSQCTMHDYHPATKVIFFADVGRNAISCWSTSLPLIPSSMAIVAQDTQKLSYPADLHITGDEVWVIANTLPRFIYARLDTNQYNFYIYRGTVQELISGTVCESRTAAMHFLN